MNKEHNIYQSSEKHIERVRDDIANLNQLRTDQLRSDLRSKEIFSQFLELLDNGHIRAAEKDSDGVWRVNSWVKEGILVGFRLGALSKMSHDTETLPFFDKDTYPVKNVDGHADNIRIVPGGTSIRSGSFINRDVVLMPPSYVNVGAYIDEGTMIDSHALVGSCAQVGKRCHIAAGAQIGGVLEPINANPCIVEDDVIMGINTSIAEGVVLKDGVVVAPGVNITSATPVYDVVREEIYTSKNGPITIPQGAVVVAGSRPMHAESEFIRANGLMIQTPIIRKYRDGSTDAKTAIEDALRS